MSILLVEDDESLAMGLEDDLKLEGYQVQMTQDGEAAMRLALAEAFDLIVLDVMLPRKDGFEVCRELRSFSDAYVVMVTARDDEVDKIASLGRCKVC